MLGKDIEVLELYALKGNRDNVPAMAGGVITDAKDTLINWVNQRFRCK
jgi:SecD/SecF fusion protein